MNRREQQTARINVDEVTWQVFRIRVIQANRSVADELARRSHQPKSRLRQRRRTPSTPNRPGGRRAAFSAERPRQRLAHLDFLNGLPYRAQQPLDDDEDATATVGTQTDERHGPRGSPLMETLE